MWGKHCSSPQYFFLEKTMKLKYQPLQYKKNKINKYHFRKKKKQNKRRKKS
jgi:hypothetical protein